MKLRYQPDDPHVLQTLLALAGGAIEGPQANTRILAGKVAISCTANTLATQRITFFDVSTKTQTPFKKGSVPFVLSALSNPSDISAQVTLSTVQESFQGFTIQALSATSQTVNVVWFAVGQTE